MNSTLNEILNELQKTRRQVLALTEPLDQEQLDRVAENQTWNMTQFLHHLYLSEIQITGLVEKRLTRATARDKGNDAEPVSVIHSLDQFEVDVVKNKYSAPSGVAPKAGIKKTQLFKDLEASRAALTTLMETADAYDLSTASFPHPAYGKLNLYQWLLFLWKHEVRHLRQMEALLK